jgi:hypothetical protein
VLVKIIRRDGVDDLKGQKNHNRKVRKENRKGRQERRVPKVFFAPFAVSSFLRP